MTTWQGEIVGHRGAAGLAPENTIESFAAAIEAGADRVEFDVRRTFDNQAVVFHDLTVDRFVPGARGRSVTRHVLAEMQRIDVGAALGRPGSRVPSLAEALDFLKGRVRLNLEVKGSGADGLLTADLAVKALAEAGVEAETIVSSFHEPVVAALRAKATGLERALIVDARFEGDAVAAARRHGCAALHASRQVCDDALLRRCRDAHLALRTWTVNDEDAMRAMMALGVDGIVSDFPDRLRRAAGR